LEAPVEFSVSEEDEERVMDELERKHSRGNDNGDALRSILGE